MSIDNIYTLAEKLDAFSQDFDFYDYMDNLTGSDPVDDLVEMLQDSSQTQGIIDYLQDTLDYMSELDENYDTISELIVNLEKLQQDRLPSLEDKFFAAEKRQSSYSYDDDYSKEEMELY